MKKFAYLTIDDSPSSDWRVKLDFLNEKNIKAIWFSTGENLEKRPEFVTAAVSAGHIIGNHSYSHPDFSQISLKNAEQEIDRTDKIIRSLLPDEDNHPRWFRFPFGRRGDSDETLSLEERTSRREGIQEMLFTRGYVVPDFIGVTYDVISKYTALGRYDWWWTFDCKEWALDPEFKGYGLHSLEDLISRMDADYFRKETDFVGLNDSDSEEVVLIHDHAHSTQLFEPLIDALLDKGVQFKTLPS